MAQFINQYNGKQEQHECGESTEYCPEVAHGTHDGLVVVDYEYGNVSHYDQEDCGAVDH